VAREATLRLYDVVRDSVVLNKLGMSKSYDHGTITFRAKKGKLIDLDKLHESIWATRLSGGTRSGLVKLEVTAIGTVVVEGNQTLLKVAGADAVYILADDPEIKPASGQKTDFQKMQEAVARGEKTLSITGRVDGWHGRWPAMLKELPAKPRKILVSSFEIVKEK
jgi:hypothetical protein